VKSQEVLFFLAISIAYVDIAKTMAVKISRILHAGYVFECEGTQIAFDTIFENPFSRNCYAFPPIRFDEEQIRQLRFDAVFISHFHDDHCSLESLNLLPRATPIYLFCVFEELFDWIRQLGFKNVIPLELNKAVRVGGFEVIPRRALDVDVDSLFQIKAAGLNILNVVDSWIDYDTLDILAAQGPWDLVQWPFQTMRELEVIAPSRAQSAPPELPEEWIEQLKVLSPRYVVPSSCQFLQESWSWYNHSFFPVTYQQFQKEVEAALPSSQVIRLNPGVSISIDSSSCTPAEPLSWIQPMGEQNVDYEYQPNLRPPSTSEIAKRFPILSAEQAEKVRRYCQADLIAKYNSLPAPVDAYFQKQRLWKLSIYDGNGAEETFFYNLNCDSMAPTTDSAGELGWTTEVPACKLFAALNQGESLTSMYLRINDTVFDPITEGEIRESDIVEDPLVRCLFNGAFGAYQWSQLQKILR
jgi:hypothetical protein